MRNYTRLLAIALVLSTPGVSSAQGTSILPPDSRTGDRLTVRTTTGQAFSGRLTGESDSVLVLESKGGERRIRQADVEQVNRRRNRILFGPLIGLGAGIAAGIPLKKLADNETGDGNSDLAKMVALGVGVGTIIDLFTRSNKTIYRRRGSSSAGFAFQPRKNGAVVRWTSSW
jgi:hypothetical protein